MLKTKSVHTPIDRADGLRILTSRFRGRGLPRTAYDVWMPNLGPSEVALKRWKTGQIAWKDYACDYTEELFLDGDLDARNRTIKNHGQKFTLRLIEELARQQTVTLLCQCPEEEQHCHRHVLQKLILSKRV
jgi:uncharacterized protein YeaO (DUF488 family)